LRRDCKGIMEEEKPHEEHENFYSNPDSSMDTGFYGFEGGRDDRIDQSCLEKHIQLLVSYSYIVLFFSIPFR
jgi:hypothetical protein